MNLSIYSGKKKIKVQSIYASFKVRYRNQHKDLTCINIKEIKKIKQNKLIKQSNLLISNQNKQSK